MADRTGLVSGPAPKGPPFKGRIQVAAYEAGKAARVAQEPRLVPMTWRHTKSVEASWEKGWDDAAPEPPGPAPRPEPAPARHPRAMWPADQPMPKAYVRQRVLVPCPHCRRLLTDEGGQAVRCRTIDGGIAYLECMCCGAGRAGSDKPFKLPVVDRAL
jgi:hypothetical protein